MRAWLAVPTAIVVTFVSAVAVVLSGLVDRSGRLPHSLIRLWARVWLGLSGVRVEVSGAENAPEAPAVYAANHTSAVDILLVFGYLPVDFRIIHKRSLYLIPLIGWGLWAAGHIGIDRKNPFRARRSLASAARRIRSGTSVAVFPEGTRSGDGSVGLFKRGSFLLAINAAAAVVPVSLAGVVRVAPSGLLSLRPGRVAVRLHPALPTTERSPDEAERLAAEVRRQVVAGLERPT